MCTLSSGVTFTGMLHVSVSPRFSTVRKKAYQKTHPACLHGHCSLHSLSRAQFFFWSLLHFCPELSRLLPHTACWYPAISGQEVFLYRAMTTNGSSGLFLFIQNNCTASRALTSCGCHTVGKPLKYTLS